MLDELKAIFDKLGYHSEARPMVRLGFASTLTAVL
jgi:hypothetical protein